MPRGGKSTRVRPAEERFWEKVDAFGDCWEWQAADNGRGYGQFYPVRTVHKYAHVYAWELLIGPIPPGMTIDHQCRNPRCVNPDHLRLLTQGDNTLAGYSASAINARRTHCVNGHPFNETNTGIVHRSSGKQNRVCRTCSRARARGKRTLPMEAA